MIKNHAGSVSSLLAPGLGPVLAECTVVRWHDCGPMLAMSAHFKHPDSGQCTWADSGASFKPYSARVWQPQLGRVMSSGLPDLGHYWAKPFWLRGFEAQSE